MGIWSTPWSIFWKFSRAISASVRSLGFTDVNFSLLYQKPLSMLPQQTQQLLQLWRYLYASHGASGRPRRSGRFFSSSHLRSCYLPIRYWNKVSNGFRWGRGVRWSFHNCCLKVPNSVEQLSRNRKWRLRSLWIELFDSHLVTSILISRGFIFLKWDVFLPDCLIYQNDLYAGLSLIQTNKALTRRGTSLGLRFTLT